jgi:hypothetical protein
LIEKRIKKMAEVPAGEEKDIGRSGIHPLLAILPYYSSSYG